MASAYDIAEAAANVYAESLLALASEPGPASAKSVGEEMKSLHQLWQSNPDFAALMSSAAISDDARRDSLKRIFADGRVSPLVLHFLMVLNDHRRSRILPHVCKAYRRQLERLLGRLEVFVTTAVEMTDVQRERIRQGVNRLTGREAVLEEKVDDSILGGILIQVGDRLYDLTVRTRLLEMRKVLLQATERRLLGGASRYVTEGN